MNESEILNLMTSIEEARSKLEESIPYQINPFDLWNPTEPQTSRVLTQILDYEYLGEKTILNSLATYLNNEFHTTFCFKNPKIIREACTLDGRFIDILIWDSDSDQAIIFENKIWNAVDQDEQLYAYFNYVKDQLHITAKNIKVLYFTLDGQKCPTEDSLGNLNRSDYICFNAQEHLIPWLKKDVIPQLHNKEIFLKASIELFCNFLQGYLNDNQNVESKIKAMINEKIENQNIVELSKTCNNVDLIREQLYNKLNEKIKEEVISILHAHNIPVIDDSVGIDYATSFIGFQIAVENWQKCTITYEVERYSLFHGIKKNSNDTTIDERTYNILSEKLNNWKRSYWWPCWQYNNYKLEDIIHWLGNNPKQFADIIKKEIDDILNPLQNENLDL